MDPNELFRSFFGFSRQRRTQKDDEKEDNEDLRRSDRDPKDSGVEFDVFTNPLEMERFFNQQMEEMLKNFGFGNGGVFFPPALGPPSGGQPIIEFPDEESTPPEGSREFMLRKERGSRGYPGYLEPGSRREDAVVDPSQVSPDDLVDLYRHRKAEGQGGSQAGDGIGPFERGVFGRRGGGGFFGHFGGFPSFGSPFTTEPSHRLPLQGEEAYDEDDQQARVWSFGQSAAKSSVLLPDGSVEEKSTFTDSQGKAVTVVTRKMGDKSVSTTTIKNPDGSQEVQENLIGLTENDRKDFDESWNKRSGRLGLSDGSPTTLQQYLESEKNTDGNEMVRKESKTYSSLFDKFFGKKE